MSNNSAQISKECLAEQTFLKAGIQKYLGMIFLHLGKQNRAPNLWQLHHLHEALAYLERGRFGFALAAAKNAMARNVRENPFPDAQATARELAGVSLESLMDAFRLIKRRTFHQYPRIISAGKRTPMSKGY